jgi:hypothetical protein
MWQELASAFSYTLSSLALSGRDLFDVLFSLLLALAVAVIISQIYKYTHRGMNYELSFMTTLVFLAPIVAVVMMFIRGDLVLSLGLIGSLSIIRFRTPIKDTRDMVFLFWVIAVGLGCGTYNWIIVIISSIFIVIVMFILHFMKYGRSRNNDFVLVVSGSSTYQNEALDELIHRYTTEARVRSQEMEEDLWEIIFELRFPPLTGKLTDNMIKEIKEIDGVNKVALLAPQLALPV